MPWIKLPAKLHPFKAALNEGVRKTASFLASVLTKLSTGPDVFYKKNGPKGPFDGGFGGPPGGGF
jgi:hypothetical protein